MIKPGQRNYPYEIELFDRRSKRAYGLKLDGQLEIGTVSSDDTVYVRNVGKRVGDFDEQRSWKSGRGIENLSDNAEGFWDSLNAWTLTPGHVYQTLQWRFAKGLRNADIYMPNYGRSLNWFALVGSGTSKYVGGSWTSSGVTADKAWLWIRKRGVPGTLTFKLASNNSGSPGSVLQTVTVTASDVSDEISLLKLFDWTGTETLSASTIYWIYVYGASTDTIGNHWEIGGTGDDLADATAPEVRTGKKSTDGSTWTATQFYPFFYITDADINRRFYKFIFDQAFYVVDRKDDATTASKLYINGDRGIATSATSTTLSDSAKTWVASRWSGGTDAQGFNLDITGAYVKIIRGTGVGQVRQITANTTTQLTVATWDTTPDTTSEYIIYSTDWFTEVGTTGLGVVTGPPAVVNQVVYFPQGDAVGMRRMQWTGSAHGFAAETATGTQGTASKVVSSYDKADGVQIWRLNNLTATGSGGISTASRANAVAWGSALAFGASISVGDSTFKSTNIAEKDGLIYVTRENGFGTISNNQYTPLKVGLESTPSPYNGAVLLSHDKFLYYSWLYSLIRVYGSEHNDIGQDFRAFGLPEGREGVFASGDSYISVDFYSVDAGTGTSSIQCWDGLAWHEVLRGFAAGRRMRMVAVQSCEGTRNRLWSEIGGELIYQEFPLNKASPILDSGVRYQHEAVIESAAIDMGTASALPKLINAITATVKHLDTDGNSVYLDWQADDNVHTSTWTPAGSFLHSPESTSFLGIENVRKFAYRLRLNSKTNSTPIDIEGIVPNGYARSPFKLIWSMRIQAGGIISRGKQVRSDQLMRWLLDSARYPYRIQMRSVYALAHNFFVTIHPPRMFPYKPASPGKPEEAKLTLVLEEIPNENT